MKKICYKTNNLYNLDIETEKHLSKSYRKSYENSSKSFQEELKENASPNISKEYWQSVIEFIENYSERHTRFQKDCPAYKRKSSSTLPLKGGF